jgi:mRNA-degrading endonuclease RelE of RelBE toxin-antitoxin system
MAHEPELQACSAYVIGVYFIVLIKETAVFSRRVQNLLDAESYRLLQLRLAADPEAGSLIPGTGGLRKMRWRGSGRGKSGGIRVIYYWARACDTILLLMMFAKNERSDLTRDQKRILRRIVEEEYR